MGNVRGNKHTANSHSDQIDALEQEIPPVCVRCTLVYSSSLSRGNTLSDAADTETMRLARPWLEAVPSTEPVIPYIIHST